MHRKSQKHWRDRQSCWICACTWLACVCSTSVRSYINPCLCVLDSTRLCRCAWASFLLRILSPTSWSHYTASAILSSRHTALLYSSAVGCTLLRALIWLAAICFVKQWSIWLTGGAVPRTHTLSVGGLDKIHTRTHTGYSRWAFSSSLRLLQPHLCLWSGYWGNECIFWKTHKCFTYCSSNGWEVNISAPSDLTCQSLAVMSVYQSWPHRSLLTSDYIKVTAKRHPIYQVLVALTIGRLIMDVGPMCCWGCVPLRGV